MVREDEQDQIYRNEDEKWNALADDIIERHDAGQPMLIGTVSIEKSEKLSGILNRRGIEHSVLNAKNHEKEALIVAQAGRKGSVTVATNMAGRGVDILLGGNAEYLARQEMAARDWDNDRYLLFEMDEEERAAYEAEYEPIYREVPGPDRRGARGGRRRSAACTSSAPSGTSRAGSTTSCAAAPAGREIRARRSSISRSRTS
jgi:preprotein translocase subunit SecA